MTDQLLEFLEKVSRKGSDCYCFQKIEKKALIAYHLSLANTGTIVGIDYKDDALSSGHEIAPEPSQVRGKLLSALLAANIPDFEGDVFVL